MSSSLDESSGVWTPIRKAWRAWLTSTKLSASDVLLIELVLLDVLLVPLLLLLLELLLPSRDRSTGTVFADEDSVSLDVRSMIGLIGAGSGGEDV